MDAFGRRVEKVVDDGDTEITTRFIYDGFRVVAEYDGGGTLLRKYVYGPGIDEPLAMIAVDGPTETWYYYHFNGLGSVIALSDANGDLVESYSYNVFGSPTIYDGDGEEISASAIGNPYMFTGRRYDEDTGLYYYRLRDYHPVLGRFVQNDPIGYIGGMNLYRYCNNNPVNWTDPLGLASSWTDTPQISPGQEWQEWLELMRLATFYSSTWGEWPDLTEYDYDWPGESSDSQGPTKGKPPEVKHLTQEEFEGKFEYVIDLMNTYSRYNFPGSWYFLTQADSNFHKDMNLYEYNGLVMRGNWWNYYMQGVAHAYFGYGKWQMNWHIYTWRWGHVFVGEPMPVTDEILEAADRGYDDWRDGHID